LLVLFNINKGKMPVFKIHPYNAADMAGRPPTKEAPLFGQRLALLRKEKGYSQEKLAAMLGTTRPNIAYYERSAKNPTLDFIQRCADALEVTVADLIGDGEAAPAARKRGPKSALESSYERVSNLPRSRQQEILKVVDALVAQSS
jgi:transcriptional regulator with XRE-family HTH domain